MDYDYLEKVNFLMLKSIYPLFNSLYENPYDSPGVRVGLAAFEDDKVTIFSHNNGVEFGRSLVDLPDKKTHDELSMKEKIKTLNDLLDMINNQDRNLDADVFDNHRLVDAIHITRCNKTGNDFFIVVSTSRRYSADTRYISEVLQFFAAYWKKYINTKESLPDDISELKDKDYVLPADEITKMKQDAIMNLIAKNTNELLYDEARFLSLINELSTQTYERSVASGVLAFYEKQPPALSFGFLHPILFEMSEARAIRKILETSKDSALIITDGVIIGVGKNVSASFEVSITGRENWIFTLKGKAAFRAVNGQFYVPYPSKSNNELSRVYLSEFPEKEKAFEKIEDIVERAQTQKHGTSIIISSSAKVEAERLSKVGRGTLIEPMDLHDNLDLVQQLTSIDGAIFLDPDGICYAIGVIVDGIATVEGSKARGARYNSILTYVAWQRNKVIQYRNPDLEVTDAQGKNSCMAVIISEDGTIDHFSTDTIYRHVKNIQATYSVGSTIFASRNG